MANNETLQELAARLIWWQAPAVSLANPSRFLAQVMTLGTWREVRQVRDIMGWTPFREVLRDAPPGVFDMPSWQYWHGFFGLAAPELPRRSLT